MSARSHHVERPGHTMSWEAIGAPVFRESFLRDSSECDDGQVLPPGAMAEREFDRGTWPAADECLRSCARRSTWPARTRLEPGCSASGPSAEVHLIRCSRFEEAVRPFPVIPAEEAGQLSLKLREPAGDENPSGALGLDRPDQPFDDCDAPILPDGTETLANPTAATPASEAGRDVLAALIRDQVRGGHPRVPDDAFEERADPCRGWQRAERGHSHHSPGVVVDDHGHPPAERPALRQSVSVIILRTVVAPRCSSARQRTWAIFLVPIVGQSVLSRRTR